MLIITENKNDLISIKVKSFLRQEKNSTNIDYELKKNYNKRLKAISNCSNSHNYTTKMHKLKFSKLRYNQTIVLG
jgi:plasmid maintenance system killer protein